MATYQEQIKRLDEEKAKRDKAERSFNDFCEILADALTPLVGDGTITKDQASAVMVAIVRGSINSRFAANGGASK